MKRLLILGLVLLLGACKVEKTGKDTYKVVTPTPEAKAAGEKVKAEAKDLGNKIQAGAAEAAKTAGAELQKVGEKASQMTTTTPAQTTETSATTTKTTTTTETRGSVSKHR
jgi:hypothetical protein